MNKMVKPNDPRVVIVGRPNVGKSSLFNRLLRRRAAIVDAQPGVTRDRLTGSVTWSERSWTLIDTGGLENPAEDKKASATVNAIRKQVEAALDDAHLALLIVDAQSGLTGLDAALADDLRHRNMPTLVVVNKCDHPAAELGAAEFSRLGLAWYPVSAAHSRGLEALRDAVTEKLANLSHVAEPQLEIESTGCRMAIVGRPNVGKSSLINAFLRQERVLVSDVPGTTRDAVDVSLTLEGSQDPISLLMTDTAGLRKTRELDSMVESFSIHQAERAVQRCDMAALVIEAGRGPTAQDKKIAALISENRRAAVIVVNKIDQVDQAALKDYRGEITRRLPFMAFCPVVFVSALKRRNIKPALTAIGQLAGRLKIQLGTGALNRAIEQATKRVQPPIVRGVRAKIYYATQTGNNPLRILLFTNDPARMPPAYRLFLEHEIRRRFTGRLDGLPIVFEMRGRKDNSPD